MVMTYRRIGCSPADRNTAATLRYILKSCQDIKVYAVERISNGDRKPGGPAGAAKRGIEAWLTEYVNKHPVVRDVPRYALRDALTRVWEEGISKQMPYQKKEWEIFRVEPRAGWKTTRDVEGIEMGSVKLIAWEDYLEGKTIATIDKTILTKNKTVAQLFDKGRLTFKWGRIDFKRTAMEELNKILVEKKWRREELLDNIKILEFCSIGTQGIWQVNFVFKK